ncbi:MAG: hypothetical protein MI924_20210 [Chloroflexales bacterium]|nr:hypothetical protein [Chloroflexales bacterium]
MISKLIVYACPTGQLADQIAAYYARSHAECGPNAAHAYPPHCTLTGFFHDDVESIPRYKNALAAALQRAKPQQPTPVITISDLVIDERFLYLQLDSPWLIALITDFAATVDSPSRRDPLRLKDWLHLSLAYEFPPSQYPSLAQLARELVDISASVGWQLRLYERYADADWTCHARCELESLSRPQ